MNFSTRMVEVRRDILKQNDMVARKLRHRFAEEGTCVVSLVSSPGSGKTAFLETILSSLKPIYRLAAVVGDLATDNDARRLARSGVQTKQINTGTVCHLEASMVEEALSGWEVNPLDFLFIENVGNLVCPASYDLGEKIRCVLMSVTEGEDKPLKYPTIFNGADVAIITKMDLAAAAEFDAATAERNMRAVRPDIRIFCVSSKTGQGIPEYTEFLVSRLKESRAFSPGRK